MDLRTNETVKRTQRDYNLGFKLAVVSQVEKGEITYKQAQRAYDLSDDLSSENVVKALKMAINKRKTSLPLIHHSDRGLQYCSAVYQFGLKVGNIKPSMTDGYDCYQNAMAERINGILKQEFLISKCNTWKELKLLIKESINTYNNNRPHLSLQMKTPNFIHEKTCEEYSTGLSKTFN